MKVYHRKEPDFLDYDEVRPIKTELARVVLDDFWPAAEVDTDDLQQAFFLTNTIEFHWSENEGVKAAPLPRELAGWRWTSVGDLIEDKDGAFHLVQSIGFRDCSVS